MHWSSHRIGQRRQIEIDLETSKYCWRHQSPQGDDRELRHGDDQDHRVLPQELNLPSLMLRT